MAQSCGRRSPTPTSNGSGAQRGGLLVLARLADGQTIEAARAEMDGIVARQRQQFPETNATPRGVGPHLHAGAVRRERRTLPGDLAGGCPAAAPHRLREHRQPADGPRDRAAARVRGAAGARCAAVATGRSGHDRRRVARGRGDCGCTPPGGDRCRGPAPGPSAGCVAMGPRPRVPAGRSRRCC